MRGWMEALAGLVIVLQVLSEMSRREILGKDKHQNPFITSLIKLIVNCDIGVGTMI